MYSSFYKYCERLVNSRLSCLDVILVYLTGQVSYEKMVSFFYRMHDPTTLNRQGNDRGKCYRPVASLLLTLLGTQYRSAIFYHDDEQKQIAEEVTEKMRGHKAFEGEATLHDQQICLSLLVSSFIFYCAVLASHTLRSRDSHRDHSSVHVL